MQFYIPHVLQVATALSSSSLMLDFLSGAHFNTPGHLRNLYKCCYQTLTATPFSSRATNSVDPYSSASVVLAELGVNHLNEKQFSQALANCWTSLDKHVFGGAMTVCDILVQCRCKQICMYSLTASD